MAFVDDYSVWIISPSAENNIQIIQDKVIPILKKWKCTSSAKFKAEKISFIYLTRYKEAGRDTTIPL